MEKTIKFALLNSLQEKFDLEKVTAYFLKDRYNKNEAEEIRSFDITSPDLSRQLCETLGIKYDSENDADVDAVAKFNKKLVSLLEYTDDKEILAHAAQVAFSQRDLDELRSGAESTIYLCGENFSIPSSDHHKYIGICGKPDIEIYFENPEDRCTYVIDFKNFENVNLIKPNVKKLQRHIDDEEILAHAAQVAFSQEDLDELRNGTESTIYLCDAEFSIPCNDHHKYIGVWGAPDCIIYFENPEDERTYVIDDKNFENVRLIERKRNFDAAQHILKDIDFNIDVMLQNANIQIDDK